MTANNDNASENDPVVVPARMINEWAYCPRLAFMEWAQGEWDDNHYTIDGAYRHRRTDKPGPELPPPEEVPEIKMATRSVWLTCEEEAITARIDLLEVEDGEVCVVDTKRGSVPDVEDGAYEPERVQLCAQALVLRSHGYACHSAMIYYAESRRRVDIVIDDALVARTREIVGEFRAAVERNEIPAPLEDSPKCRGCSLVGICLPDEVNLLAKIGAKAAEPAKMRQLLAPCDEGLPLAVTTQGAKIRKRKGEFDIYVEDERVGSTRLRETTEVLLFGRVEITTPCLQAAMEEEIPVCFFSQGGWFYGMATGHPHKNVHLRIAQYACAGSETKSLDIAREMVRSKIRNQRTVLRRNHPGLTPYVLAELQRLADEARQANEPETLLGLEGSAARHYFQHFGDLLRDGEGQAFDFEKRNRRPPRDPVNAALSYAYAMLTKDAMHAVLAAGFDPYLGFFHRPRYGRPALALDLMEEFRPLIADSVVLTAFNNGELNRKSFVRNAAGCAFTSYGKRDLIRCYERRMDQQITHPLFGYTITWRRMMQVQARLLGRHVMGEIPAYVPIETR